MSEPRPASRLRALTFAGVPLRHSIFGRMLALGLLAMLPVVLFGIQAVREQYRLAHANALQKSVEIARVVSTLLDDHFASVDAVILTVGHLVAEGELDPLVVDARLLALQRSLPAYFSNIAVRRADGTTISASLVPLERRGDVSDREYFKNALASRSLVIGNPIVSRAVSDWVSVAARAQIEADGSIRRVISVATLLNRFQQLLTPESLPPGSLITVLSQDGTIVARSRDADKWVGKRIPPGRYDHLRPAQAQTATEEIITLDGIKLLSGWSTAARMPWTVIAGIPSDVALAPARELLLREIARALLMFTLAVGLAWWLSRRLSLPVQALTQDAARLATGDLAHRSRVESTSEIGVLTRGFNHMAGELESAFAKVRESDARFRALTSLSSDWYWEQDEQYRFTFHSPSLFDKVGTNATRIYGKTRWDLYGAEAIGTTWDAHRGALDARETFRGLTVRYRTPDGMDHFIISSGTPLHDAAGKFIGYHGVATHINEQIRMEREREAATRTLREHEELLQVMLQTTPAATFLIRWKDGVVIDANPAAAAMCGLTLQQLIGNAVANRFEVAAQRRDVIKRLQRDGVAHDMDVPFRMPTGVQTWVSFSAVLTQFRGVKHVIFSIIDIAARKKLEQDLLAANERQRHLSRRLLNAQEDERRQIAHELHDEIGQTLTALTLHANLLRARQPLELRGEVGDWIDMLKHALEQVRDLSRMMRPVQLDHLGLASALRNLLATQQRATDWTVRYVGDDSLPRFDAGIEIACYRVAQESLTNAARHAGATRVEIAVDYHAAEGELHMRISDNGEGFDPTVANVTGKFAAGSLGLHGMRERVALAGGRFSVDAAPGRGTRIEVVLLAVALTAAAGEPVAIADAADAADEAGVEGAGR